MINFILVVAVVRRVFPSSSSASSRAVSRVPPGIIVSSNGLEEDTKLGAGGKEGAERELCCWRGLAKEANEEPDENEPDAPANAREPPAENEEEAAAKAPMGAERRVMVRGVDNTEAARKDGACDNADATLLLWRWTRRRETVRAVNTEARVNI